MTTPALSTAVDYVKAPLLYKGKVRELYDLGEHYLIVVTDRISAFDYVLDPAVPEKATCLTAVGLTGSSKRQTFMTNHVVHTDVEKLGDLVTEPELLKNRIMVSGKRSELISNVSFAAISRAAVGDNMRKHRQINGIKLREGLRKNERFEQPIFTPAAKNDVGHDEDIPFARMQEMVGAELPKSCATKASSYTNSPAAYCEERGIILADCKFEFGLIDGKVILIDEIFTPDSSRFWAKDNYELDTEIDSMDKEPVRTYLLGSDWDKNSKPAPLPTAVVARDDPPLPGHLSQLNWLSYKSVADSN